MEGLDLPVLLAPQFTHTANSGWNLSQLRLSLVTLTIVFILLRLFTRLHTAPSTSFYLYREPRGLHLKINIDTLKKPGTLSISLKEKCIGILIFLFNY